MIELTSNMTVLTAQKMER